MYPEDIDEIKEIVKKIKPLICKGMKITVPEQDDIEDFLSGMANELNIGSMETPYYDKGMTEQEFADESNKWVKDTEESMKKMNNTITGSKYKITDDWCKYEAYINLTRK